MRRAARKDGNHNQVADWLMQLGAGAVVHTHQIGGGFPDLLVRIGRAFYPAEVKRPRENLEPSQVKWWAKQRIKPVILRTLGDCAAFVNTASTLRNS